MPPVPGTAIAAAIGTDAAELLALAALHQLAHPESLGAAGEAPFVAAGIAAQPAFRRHQATTLAAASARNRFAIAGWQKTVSPIT